jgi:glycosyltransferase involved in cell wall biosynthesis
VLCVARPVDGYQAQGASAGYWTWHVGPFFRNCGLIFADTVRRRPIALLRPHPRTYMPIERSPLVSALCCTRNRPEQLERAIRCFMAQSHSRRELVIVHRTDDHATAAVVERYVDRPDILVIRLRPEEQRSLGDLRNLSIAASRGEYFCVWDDDDWYHVDRMRLQLEAVRLNQQAASLLGHIVLFDRATDRAYFSRFRLWEPSLLARRDVIDARVCYAPLDRGEDTYLLKELIDHSRVIPVLEPSLYVYQIHSQNTCNREHFRRLIETSQPLSTMTSTLVRDVLAQRCSVEEGSRLLTEEGVLSEYNYFHFTNTPGRSHVASSNNMTQP